jgi:hypothetical protein
MDIREVEDGIAKPAIDDRLLNGEVRKIDRNIGVGLHPLDSTVPRGCADRRMSLARP